MRRFAASLALAFMLAASPAKADLPDLLKGLSEEQIRDTMDFVVGNMIFIAFHESAHMLIDEFDLPVTGREEDSADILSTLILLKDESDYLDQALMATAAAQLIAGDDLARSGQEPPYWDEHGLDKQRAYNVACLAYGKDPQKFLAFADAIQLPESRRNRCAMEYADAERGWNKVLADQVMPVGGIGQFPVTYEPTADPQFEFFANVMREADVLGVIEKKMSEQFIFDSKIPIVLKDCGFINAYWDPANRQMVFCHELLAWEAEMYTRQFR
jgi:hypothetical protein